jgi:transposase
MSVEIEKRRRYSREFKQQAVEMIVYGEKEIAQVARELGVPVANLSRWRREFLGGESSAPKAPGRSLNPAEMEQEIRRLRRELRDTQTERDILKKTVSIFSQGKEEE